MPKKMSKRHPEEIKKVNALKVNDELTSFVNELASDIETEITNRAVWENNIDKAINLRYGIRNKKTSPWVGCSNFSIPLIDTHINNNKSAYINLLNANPICTFEPFGFEDVEPARKRELLFDWRMKTKVRYFEPYSYGVDLCLEQGIVIFKVVWKFTQRSYEEYINLKELPQEIVGAIYDTRVTDQILMKIFEEELGIDMTYQENYDAVVKAIEAFRQGDSELSLTLVETVDNQPEVTACSLREDVVIPVNTDDIQKARFIDHQFYKSVNEIMIDIQSGKYQKYTRDEVDDWGGGIEKKKKRSLSETDEDMVLIHEVCCWYDINGDDIDERCIVTYPEASPDQILRFIEVPYDHGCFPYVAVKRELNARGLYSSRGYPYIDEDYQVGISKALNQAIDNGDIVNAPKVVYKKGCVSNIKNNRYTPAEPVEIINGTPADYEIRQVGNMSQGILFQQAQFLKSWADQRVGNVQSVLSDPTNMAGAGQQGMRTKYEAQLIQQMSSGSQSLDLLVWQMQMREVYYQIDALYEQYGADMEEVMITGEPPMKVSRREIQGKYSIIPNGRLENTDPQIRAMKVMNLMKVFAGDPDIKQPELKKLYLMDYDPRIAKKVMMTPEEIQKRDAMMMQQQQMMKGQVQNDMIQMKRTQDLLEVNKEQMLSKIPRREIVVDYDRSDNEEGGKGKKKGKAKVTYGG